MTTSSLLARPHRGPFLRRGLVLAGLALVLSASACSSSASGNGSAGTRLTVAWSDDEPANLDRQITPHGSVPDLLYNVTDPVARLQSDGTLQPGLATAWKDVNATTLEVTLRTDVVFSDGTKLDANGFALSMNRMISPASAMGAENLPTLKSVKVVNSNTVDLIHMPDATLMKEVALAADIFSPKQVQDNPASIKTDPIGSGPYKVQSYKSGSKLVLVARSDYWGAKLYGTPTIKEIDILFGLDPDVRLADVQSGQAQLGMDINADSVNSIDKSMVLNLPGPEVYYLRPAFNEPMGNDVRIRKAVDLSIDRAQIGKLFGGLGTATNAMWPTNVVGYSASRPLPQPDLAMAKQLVQQAGATGKTLQLVYSADIKIGMQDVAEAVASMVDQTGLKVQLTNQDSATFKNTDRNLKNPPEWMLIPISYETLEGTRTLDARIGCDGSVSTYCNKQVDQLDNQALAEADPAKRVQDLQQLWDLVYADEGVIPLVNPPLIWVHSKNLTIPKTAYPYVPFSAMRLG
jgi:peptide/nickel transport system substrate-binding protein